MDLTIHVKVELVETPALINCFSAFCTTIERCTQMLAASDRDLSVEVEATVPQPVKAEEAKKPEAEALAKAETPAEAPSEPVQAAKTPTPKKYTLDDFRSACVPLIDADKAATAAIQAVVKSFGVNSLMDIPEDKYEELAEKLRGLGAKL